LPKRHGHGKYLGVSRDEEALYLAALAQIPSVGAHLLFELKTTFGSYRAAWEAHPAEWLDVRGVTGGLRERFQDFRSVFALEQFARSLEEKSVFLFTIEEDVYPQQLKELDSPPPVLYARGQLAPLLPDKISIVGTRKASAVGRKQTSRLAYDLASLGLTIVSGMALGIDGAAHEGALEAGGLTIAVLGSGIDEVYPPQHESLYRRILEHGLVLSEHPPGVSPLKEHFPRRNRIIAGLSKGTVVTEAPLNSGALITARLANDMGRDVFAMPGPVASPIVKGCHQLIKSGEAKLVEDADDVLVVFGEKKSDLLARQRERLQEKLDLELVSAAPEAGPAVSRPEPDEPKPSPKRARATSRKQPAQPPAPSVSDEDMRLLSAISYSEGTHLNTLARKLKLSIAELSARLTLLEIRGLVKSLPGGFFQRL